MRSNVKKTVKTKDPITKVGVAITFGVCRLKSFF